MKTVNFIRDNRKNHLGSYFKYGLLFALLFCIGAFKLPLKSNTHQFIAIEEDIVGAEYVTMHINSPSQRKINKRIVPVEASSTPKPLQNTEAPKLENTTPVSLLDSVPIGIETEQRVTESTPKFVKKKKPLNVVEEMPSYVGGEMVKKLIYTMN